MTCGGKLTKEGGVMLLTEQDLHTHEISAPGNVLMKILPVKINTDEGEIIIASVYFMYL